MTDKAQQNDDTYFEDGFDSLVEEEIELKEPSMFKVILLNDDYTSMEFVVMVLETIFKKSEKEAYEIMMSVHKTGSGLAGVYTKEIADTKLFAVHRLAKDNEFPLKCMLEAE